MNQAVATLGFAEALKVMLKKAVKNIILISLFNWLV